MLINPAIAGFFRGKEVKNMADRHEINLTKDPALVDGLQQPTREVKFSVAGVRYKFLRGADDPTPDNVLQIGGIFINVDDGRMGEQLTDVV